MSTGSTGGGAGGMPGCMHGFAGMGGLPCRGLASAAWPFGSPGLRVPGFMLPWLLRGFLPACPPEIATLDVAALVQWLFAAAGV